MRGADPTVVLIPGVGMIAWGKTKSESRVTAEFYKSAIEVMRGAESVSTYTALPRQEAFDIEYWHWRRPSCGVCRPRRNWLGRLSSSWERVVASAVAWPNGWYRKAR